METVFLKLVNMSISATWLVGVVLILRLALKRAPKWLHCMLWALVAVRLICPFSFESVTSLLPSREVLPSNVIASGDIQVNTGFEAVDNRINSGVLEGYMEGVTVPVGHTHRIMTVLSILWIAGMAVMVAYAVFSWIRLRRRVAASVETAPNVRICDYIDTPFILGMVRPVIYLPSSMGEKAAASVLAHERAHLQRRDHWWKPFGYLLLSIHWFNPVMWLGYILLCRDIEMACDEKVIRGMGAQEKKQYSEALLACSMPRRMISACPLAFGEVGVKDRVKSVLHYKKPAFWLIVTAVAACLVVAVCFLTDPAANTIAKQFGIKAVDGVLVSAGEIKSAVLDADRVQDFLKNARIGELPISQDRSENRAKDYSIALSAGGGILYFDADFTDVWLHDNVKPSLSYRLENPDQARTFFEETLGMEIPEAVGGGPDENGNYYFTATVLRTGENAILVEPLEGCWERESSDKIWVNEIFQSAIRVGDTVRVFYNGMVAETYPAQVDWVYNIEVIDRVFTEAVTQEIATQLGTYDFTLFDYQIYESTVLAGISYDGEYGIVYINNGSISVVDFKKPNVESDPDAMMTNILVDSQTFANFAVSVIIIQPEFEGTEKMLTATDEYDGEALQYVYNYPALLVLDTGSYYSDTHSD